MTILRVKIRIAVHYVKSTTKIDVVEYKRLFKNENMKCRKRRESLMLKCT
ncbi:hypothetical protein HanIR_Chr16g0838821 [Helianthus annuus]|nr:hypothetical protein HanIR_Chr16g0838821 [Helianthus annuus]